MACSEGESYLMKYTDLRLIGQLGGYNIALMKESVILQGPLSTVIQNESSDDLKLHIRDAQWS